MTNLITMIKEILVLQILIGPRLIQKLIHLLDLISYGILRIMIGILTHIQLVEVKLIPKHILIVPYQTTNQDTYKEISCIVTEITKYNKNTLATIITNVINQEITIYRMF